VSQISLGNSIVNEYLALSVKAVNGYFDKLFAKEIYTDKVCIKKSNGTDVCLTGDQVEGLMNTSQLPLLTPSQGTVGGNGGSSTSSDTDTTASSTDQTGNATTTEEAPGTSSTSTVPVGGDASSTPETVPTSDTSSQPNGENPPVLDVQSSNDQEVVNVVNPE
jgi:hypothetical protein